MADSVNNIPSQTLIVKKENISLLKKGENIQTKQSQKSSLNHHLFPCMKLSQSKSVCSEICNISSADAKKLGTKISINCQIKKIQNNVVEGKKKTKGNRI